MYVNKKPQTAATQVSSRPFASGSGKELSIIQQGENILYEAQLLHKDLQVKTIFQNWIKRRIEEFGFEEGADYFPILEIVKGSKKPVTKYLLTIDMCKELGMLERNAIGRAIRKRFIAKEKELRGISQLPKEVGLFKGIKARRINDREMYPYGEMRQRSGYSTRSSSAGHRNRYWMHFVKEGSILYCTKEFALHLYHQRQVYNNRAIMINSQPVLPFNFGDTDNLLPNIKVK